MATKRQMTNYEMDPHATATEAAPITTLPTMNTSGIRPTEYKVLIKPKEVAEKIGSVYVPPSTQELEQHAQVEGVLVAVAPHAFTYETWEDCQPPQVGDTVLFAKYAGARVQGRDGEWYKVVNDKDIAAVMD